MAHAIVQKEFPHVAGASETEPPQEAVAFADSLPSTYQNHPDVEDVKIFPPIFLGSVSGNPLWLLVYILIYRHG